MKNFKSDKPCVVCGENRENYTCWHHIYSRKAFPEHANDAWNLVSVCQHHHNIFHSKPLSYMASNYPRVKEWLLDNGWEESELNGWVHY